MEIISMVVRRKQTLLSNAKSYATTIVSAFSLHGQAELMERVA